MADMAEFAAHKLYHILHDEFAVRGADDSLIRLLAAAGGIERGLLHKDSSPLAIRKRVYQFRIRGEHRNFGLIRKIVIADEFRGNARIDGLVYRHVRPHIVGDFTGLAGCLPLDFHGFFEAFFIDRHSLLFQDLLRQIQRESVGIIKFERILAIQGLFPLFLCLRHHIGQNGQSLINGLVKLLFFLGNYLEDKFLFLFQFGISILGAFDHILCQFNQELSRNVKQPSVPAGAPQETPEHISTALVGRHDSVRDHKGYGTDMVGDDTQGDIRLFIPAIFGMGQSADMIP